MGEEKIDKAQTVQYHEIKRQRTSRLVDVEREIRTNVLLKKRDQSGELSGVIASRSVSEGNRD